MDTTSEIKNIIADEFIKCFDFDKCLRFKNNERILANVYHDGKVQYYNSRLFELKKEAVSASAYARNWVEYECFDLDHLESYEHITRECEFRFVQYLDLLCTFFPRNGYTIHEAIKDSFHQVRKIVSTFYDIASKVISIQELQMEIEKKPFLSQDQIIGLWEYTGVIWECDKLETLQRVFDMDNTIIEHFKIIQGKKETFYRLLRKLYNKNKPENTTQKKLFESFFERYGLSWSSFDKGNMIKSI